MRCYLPISLHFAPARLLETLTNAIETVYILHILLCVYYLVSQLVKRLKGSPQLWKRGCAMPWLGSLLLLMVLSSLAAKMFYLFIRQADLLCGGRKRNGSCWQEALTLTAIIVLWEVAFFFCPQAPAALTFFLHRLPLLGIHWGIHK